MTSHSQPDIERANIEARLTELRAKQEAATGWGAAVGVRSEEIRSLERRLASMTNPSQNAVTGSSGTRPAGELTPVKEGAERLYDDLQKWKLAETELSNAYLRLRRLIPGAMDTPHAPTKHQVWATTEDALKRALAVTSTHRGSGE